MSRQFEKGDRVVLDGEYRYLGKRWADLEKHTAGTIRAVRFNSDYDIRYADVHWDEEVDRNHNSAVDVSCLIDEADASPISDDDLNFVYTSLGVKKPTPCPTCGCTCSQTEQ